MRTRAHSTRAKSCSGPRTNQAIAGDRLTRRGFLRFPAKCEAFPVSRLQGGTPCDMSHPVRFAVAARQTPCGR
jgi:hypothetical protein